MTFSHYYNLLKIFFEKVKSFFYSSDFSYLNLFNYFRKSQSILCSVIFQCSLLIGLFSVVILVLDIIKKFWIFFIKFSWKSFFREKGLFLLWKNITKWLVILKEWKSFSLITEKFKSSYCQVVYRPFWDFNSTAKNKNIKYFV